MPPTKQQWCRKLRSPPAWRSLILESVLCGCGSQSANSGCAAGRRSWTPRSDDPPCTPGTYVRCEQVMRKMLNTLVNIGFPCWVTIVAWSQSKLTVAWRRGECLYDELVPLQKAYFITDMEASHGKEMTKYGIYLLSLYDIVFQIFTHCGILLLEYWIVFYVESYPRF